MASSQLVGRDIWVTESWHYSFLESTGCLLQCVQCLMSKTENFLHFIHTYDLTFLLPANHRFHLTKVPSALGYNALLLLFKSRKSFESSIIIFVHCDNFHFNLQGMKKWLKLMLSASLVVT